MNKKSQKDWFGPAKYTHGGIRIINRRGWLVVVVFLVLEAASFTLYSISPALGLITIVLLVIIFAIIVYKKGGRPNYKVFN